MKRRFGRNRGPFPRHRRPPAQPVSEDIVRDALADPQGVRVCAAAMAELGPSLATPRGDDQGEELLRLYQALMQARCDLADTRRVVGRVELREIQRLVQRIRAQVKNPVLPEAPRRQLQADAAALLSAWDEMMQAAGGSRPAPAEVVAEERRREYLEEAGAAEAAEADQPEVPR